MGTDEVGRDVYSRIVHGTRISLSVGLGVMVLALLIGVPLGLLAGLSGGPVDYAIMRLVEVFTAVPALMLAVLLISVFGCASEILCWPHARSVPLAHASHSITFCPTASPRSSSPSPSASL
jgi:ABC-type dipeptide/oligopeptide/nickel transport system permease subunit